MLFKHEYMQIVHYIVVVILWIFLIKQIVWNLVQLARI